MAFALAGLLLLAGLYLVVEHIRGGRALRKHERQMRAQGEKFTIAELRPEPVPPEKNAAGMLAGLAFPSIGIVPQQLPPAMRHATSGVAIPVVKVQAWSSTVSGSVLLATNASSTNEASAGRRPGTRGPGAGRNSTRRYVFTSEMLATNMAAHAGALAQLHAALRLGPVDHQLDYSQGFNIKLPHLSSERQLAQWLRVASLSAAQQTNLPASLTNLLALAALGHATTNEQLIISQLFRIALFQVAVSAVWEAMQAEGWTDEQLRALQAALGPSDFVRSMGRALEMERAMNLKFMDDAGSKAVLFADYIKAETDWPGSTGSGQVLEAIARGLREFFLQHVYQPLWSFAWKDSDKLEVARAWQLPIDLARKQAGSPDWKQHLGSGAEGSGSALEMYIEGPPAPTNSLWTRIRRPFAARQQEMGVRYLNRPVATEATLQLVSTALALERFRLARAAYPASLDELVPALLAGRPLDPLDGQPLRYRLRADGTYLLYSVGADGRDDGGDDRRKLAGDKPQFLLGRDMVWPRAATPEELRQVIEEDGRSRWW